MKIYALTLLPGLQVVELEDTPSTNDYVRERRGQWSAPMTLVTAEYQSKGRGATGGWQSERGKNLLFSLLTHPTSLPATQMFRLSVAACLAICRVLNSFVEGCTIKWPNDIYYKDGKLVGILIENELRGKTVSDCVMGIGVNVNQTTFLPDAPNPVSLAMILGHEVDRSQVLDAIVREFFLMYHAVQDEAWSDVFAEYKERLYRREGTYEFSDDAGQFCATIHDVEEDGHLLLRDEQGTLRRYAFKEVRYTIPNNFTNLLNN